MSKKLGTCAKFRASNWISHVLLAEEALIMEIARAATGDETTSFPMGAIA